MPTTVLWPTLLGTCFLIAGMVAYWRDDRSLTARNGFGLMAFGPAFIAAGLAAFAGEHFTIAATIASLVPKWIPGRLFIAYFVGVAHLAAALSFVARRYVRWSSICLALMFAMFALLMDVPGAMAKPSALAWMLAARQATFAVSALALFAVDMRDRSSSVAHRIAKGARFWTAIVVTVYGLQHLVHPEFTPGVPSPVPFAAWVPAPQAIAYATGIVLAVCGLMMFTRRYAVTGAAVTGALMVALTVVLYVPQYFTATNGQQYFAALNFTFDTLLFGGTMLVIGSAIAATESPGSHPA